MLSAIYFIENTINGKIYIGSAMDVPKRWAMHRYMLKHNKHHSILLQRAWNKYGEEAFDFGLLEIVAVDQLIEREQYFIDLAFAADRNSGYNICPIAGSSLGVKQSEQARKNKSIARKGKPNGLLGYKHREDSKLKMRLTRANKQDGRKITRDQAGIIRERFTNGESTVSLSVEFGMNPATARKIVSNKIWFDPEYEYKFEGLSNGEKVARQLRGRRTGIRAKKAAFTDVQVREIREKYLSGGVTHVILAEEYGVSDSCIWGLLNRKTYQNVD